MIKNRQLDKHIHSRMEIIGYHGTTRERAEKISQHGWVKPSNNDYDWLGPGTYFWAFGLERAQHWAKERCESNGPATPAVIEVTIRPKNCLNLLNPGSTKELKEAYSILKKLHHCTGTPLPNNIQKRHNLDCAVIQLLHKLRQSQGLPAYDCVLGAFEEGKKIFPGSAARQESHVQFVVCDISCIVNSHILF